MIETSKSVTLQNVSKIYMGSKDKDSAFKAVDNVTLDIKAGTFVTLLGPSGCGKTTTLRMIAGFEYPDEGDILLDGASIKHIPPNKRDIAMVFQSYALFPHYNVFDNIAYGLKIRKMQKKQIREKVMEMLELVELSGLENRMTNQLSGGQQQRVALARALVMEPGVLLFDEPLSNLDAKLRMLMRTEIRRIQQKIGITAVYVTHDQAEALSLSDEIIIMKEGLIQQVGSPRDLYYRPNNKFVADFIGEANFLEGTVIGVEGQNRRLDITGRTVEITHADFLEQGDDCVIVLRPEAITVGEQGLLPCQVVFSTFMGAYQNYHVKVGDDILIINDTNPVNRKIFEKGEDAFISFDLDHVHVLKKED